MRIDKFMKEVHDLAKEKGWYSPPKTDLECLMLMVSELSEAVEEVRKGTPPIYQNHSDPYVDILIQPGEESWVSKNKPEGLAVELADVILRIFDYAEYKKLNLYEAIMLKHEYNKTRPFRHGKK